MAHPEEGSRTQLDLLPREIQVLNIDNVATLESATDLEPWKVSIRYLLRLNRCHNLIRADLPRPSREEDGYTAWKYYSIVVAGWLYGQVSDSIKRRLDNSGVTKGDDMFADVVMETIERVVLEEDGRLGSLSVRISTFWALNRSQYNSASDFIFDVQMQMQVFHVLKVPIPWIVALVRILQQLEEELPMVKLMKEELRDMSPKHITREKFEELCMNLKVAATHAKNMDTIKAENSGDPKANSSNKRNKRRRAWGRALKEEAKRSDSPSSPKGQR